MRRSYLELEHSKLENEWSLESLGYIKIFSTSSKINQDKFYSSARRTPLTPRHESFEVVFVLTVCWQRTTWLSRLNLITGRPLGSWDFRWGWEGHNRTIGHNGIFTNDESGGKVGLSFAYRRGGLISADQASGVWLLLIERRSKYKPKLKYLFLMINIW